jgi:hypothetical protein
LQIVLFFIALGIVAVVAAAVLGVVGGINLDLNSVVGAAILVVGALVLGFAALLWDRE